MYQTIAALLCAQSLAIQIGTGDGFNIKIEAEIELGKNEVEPREVSCCKTQFCHSWSQPINSLSQSEVVKLTSPLLTFFHVLGTNCSLLYARGTECGLIYAWGNTCSLFDAGVKRERYLRRIMLLRVLRFRWQYLGRLFQQLHSRLQDLYQELLQVEYHLWHQLGLRQSLPQRVDPAMSVMMFDSIWMDLAQDSVHLFFAKKINIELFLLSIFTYQSR